MKFKLLGDNNLEGDLFYEILKNRGFSDDKIEDLINIEDFNPPSILDIENAEVGIDMFINHIRRNSNIVIIQD